MMNKYDISLFLLKHKRSKVRDSRLRLVAQALLTGSDEEKFARPEKYFPNLSLLSKGCLPWGGPIDVVEICPSHVNGMSSR